MCREKTGKDCEDKENGRKESRERKWEEKSRQRKWEEGRVGEENGKKRE